MNDRERWERLVAWVGERFLFERRYDGRTQCNACGSVWMSGETPQHEDGCSVPEVLAALQPPEREPDGEPWIGVDLDGTLAHYDGWVSPEHIGEPVPAMVERVRAWLSAGIRVRVLTARWSHREERETISRVVGDWTEKHLGERLEVTGTKDYGMLELWDDRAVQVEPNTGRILGRPTREATGSPPPEKLSEPTTVVLGKGEVWAQFGWNDATKEGLLILEPGHGSHPIGSDMDPKEKAARGYDTGAHFKPEDCHPGTVVLRFQNIEGLAEVEERLAWVRASLESGRMADEFAVAAPPEKVERETALAAIEKAMDMVSALCRPRGSEGSREWIMSIPAQADHDPDMVIGAALREAKRALGGYQASPPQKEGDDAV